jgi:uncharacterized protein
VIGCNFCPFAAKAMLNKNIHFEVLENTDAKASVAALQTTLQHFDAHAEIETGFLIFANDFADFDDYLDLVEAAEKMLRKEKYEGIYQVASFHPQYLFAGSTANDAANYTNRSIYPMLHILREAHITEALADFPEPEKIPERNIDYARQKGLMQMQLLRASCLAS